MNGDHGSLVRGDESDLYKNCNSVKDDQVSNDAAGSTRGNFDNEAVAISESILNKQKTNSMVSVRERTIPTERPPLVGEVIANLCG
jgi:hypothetical protein